MAKLGTPDAFEPNLSSHPVSERHVPNYFLSTQDHRKFLLLLALSQRLATCMLSRQSPGLPRIVLQCPSGSTFDAR